MSEDKFWHRYRNKGRKLFFDTWMKDLSEDDRQFIHLFEQSYPAEMAEMTSQLRKWLAGKGSFYHFPEFIVCVELAQRDRENRLRNAAGRRVNNFRDQFPDRAAILLNEPGPTSCRGNDGESNRSTPPDSAASAVGTR